LCFRRRRRRRLGRGGDGELRPRGGEGEEQRGGGHGPPGKDRRMGGGGLAFGRDSEGPMRAAAVAAGER